VYRSVADVVEALSNLVRTGWMLRGVPACVGESVADHSMLAALIAFEAGMELRGSGVSVDPFRAALIALVHDIGESVVGDIPKVSGVPGDVKSRVEFEAVRSLPVSEELKSLFVEFEEGSSLEARLARFAEVFATLLKSTSYLRLGYGVEDIACNMYRVSVSLSRELGLEDFMERLLDGRAEFVPGDCLG
jgi:putative hydrolase of HD superfamily